MSNSQKSFFLIILFLLISCFILLLDGVNIREQDLIASNRLSQGFIRGNSEVLSSNKDYSEKTSILKEAEVLGSNTGEVEVVETFIGEITGYASLDPRAEEGVCFSGNPAITASGAKVERGVVAANFLEFGTEIRIPEYFGSEVFIVKDRMASEYGWGNIDIWFKNQDDAKKLGRVSTKIEIVK